MARRTRRPLKRKKIQMCNLQTEIARADVKQSVNQKRKKSTQGPDIGSVPKVKFRDEWEELLQEAQSIAEAIHAELDKDADEDRRLYELLYAHLFPQSDK